MTLPVFSPEIRDPGYVYSTCKCTRATHPPHTHPLHKPLLCQTMTWRWLMMLWQVLKYMLLCPLSYLQSCRSCPMCMCKRPHHPHTHFPTRSSKAFSCCAQTLHRQSLLKKKTQTLYITHDEESISRRWIS